ncbi:MAG: ATP-binding protein [Gammaproteobacteria bacterium]|nr:ATP-binding protein [Gammaproteobacteria bacterium]
MEAIETPTAKTETAQNSIEHIKAYANIPKRYKDAKFEARTKEQEELIKKIRANISGRKISEVHDMLIFGKIGTGKTHVLCGLLNTLIETEVYCRYVTEFELLELYSRKEFVKYDAFKEVAFLVIDELGKDNLQDWQKKQIEELISYRYNEMLPTIFVTNLTTDEFKHFIGDRAIDRMRDNKIIRVSLVGDSLRGAI